MQSNQGQSQSNQGQQYGSYSDPRQTIIQQVQEATQRLQSASNEQERREWARQVHSLSGQLTSETHKTSFLVEATVPSSQPVAQLAQQIENSPLKNGVKEIGFRREQDGTGKLRVSCTQEAMPRINELLQQVGNAVQQYATSSF